MVLTTPNQKREFGGKIFKKVPVNQYVEETQSRRKDLTVIRMLGSHSRKLGGIKMDNKGRISSFDISKQQLSRELNLNLRDLRLVDPSCPSQFKATMAARPNVILFSVDHLKMIIKNNETFIFNTNHEEVERFVPLLQQQLRAQLQGQEETEDQNEAKVDNQEEASLRKQRFEHIVLDSALSLISVSLTSVIKSLEPAVGSALLDLRGVSRGLDVVQTQVDELLPLKNKIDEFRMRCTGIKQCISDVLNNDEDMQQMFLPITILPIEGNTETQKIEAEALLGRRHRNLNKKKFVHHSSPSLLTQKWEHHPRRKRTRNTQSLEILLENYLNEVEWITSKVDDLLNEITNTEEYVVLQLDFIRNRILKFELYLSISTFIVTCGALTTGLFGMNLINHFENDQRMFTIVTILLFSSMGLGYRSFMRHARKQKLL